MLMVYITCKNETEARYIAQHLLETKLIACANFFPCESMYWWKKEIKHEKEYILIAKTIKKNFDRIKNEVLKTHSYDVPCIVGYEIKKGHKDYLDWVKSCVE